MDIIDANEVLDQQSFLEKLQSGVSVVHLADYIRLKAIKLSGAAGWFLDCDPIWFKPAPSPTDLYLQHLFGSLTARPRQTPCNDFGSAII